MKKISVIYTQNLQTKAIHERSGRVLFTEAPVDNQGTGENFSPTDLVVTALGSCILTVIGIATKKYNFSFDGASVALGKTMVQDPRRIGAIDMTFDFSGLALGDKEKKIVEYAIGNCPVMRSLHPDITKNIAFNY